MKGLVPAWAGLKVQQFFKESPNHRVTNVDLRLHIYVKSFLENLISIWQPHAGQAEFLLHPAKFKVLSCGRRWGKTDVCAVQILGLLTGDSPTRHVIIAPTQDQANLLFDRLHQLLLQFIEANAISEVPTVKLTPHPKLTFGKHTVLARSGHIARALRGNEATHVVIDEAAFVPEELVTEVVMPMLATTNGSLTLISTPRGRNHFWRFFNFGQTGEHGFWSKRAASSESPYVSPHYLQVQRELISERAYRVEYEAEFVDSEGQVFRSEAIEECMSCDDDETESSEAKTGDPPIRIGVDFGRYRDATAIIVVQGTRQKARVIQTERFHKLPWKQIVERVARTVNLYPGAVVECDGTGVGDPLVEALQAQVQDVAVRRFVFTAESKFQIVDNLVWMVENVAIRFRPDPTLIRELEHFQITHADSGAHRFEAQSGYHDDLVMALALACRDLPASYGRTIYARRRREFDWEATG